MYKVPYEVIIDNKILKPSEKNVQYNIHDMPDLIVSAPDAEYSAEKMYSDRIVGMFKKLMFVEQVKVFAELAGEIQKYSEEIADSMLETKKEKDSLQEFYNASTKRLGIDKAEMKQAVEKLSKAFPVKEITSSIILKAIDIQIKNAISFYDSLILSTAGKNNCVVCYSEDLNDGQVIDGVKVINPFLCVGKNQKKLQTRKWKLKMKVKLYCKFSLVSFYGIYFYMDFIND